MDAINNENSNANEINHDEEFTPEQKSDWMTYSKGLLILCFSSSSAITILAYIYSSYIPSFLMQILFFLGIAIATICLLNFIWTFKHKSDHLTLVIFILSGVIIASLISSTIFIVFQIPLDLNYFLATMTDDQLTTAFYTKYYVFMTLIFAAIAITFITFILVTYSIYCSVGQHHLVANIHVYNLIYLLLSFWLFVIRPSMQFIVIQIVSAIIIYMCNAKKQKIGYFIAGILLLGLISVNQVYHYNSFRETQIFRNKFYHQCESDRNCAYMADEKAYHRSLQNILEFVHQIIAFIVFSLMLQISTKPPLIATKIESQDLIFGLIILISIVTLGLTQASKLKELVQANEFQIPSNCYMLQELYDFNSLNNMELIDIDIQSKSEFYVLSKHSIKSIKLVIQRLNPSEYRIKGSFQLVKTFVNSLYTCSKGLKVQIY